MVNAQMSMSLLHQPLTESQQLQFGVLGAAAESVSAVATQIGVWRLASDLDG